MQQYACPNCGAPLTFRSSVSIYTSCNFCRSTVVRHDKDVELHGIQAEQLEDMSPFMVGTRGKYKGKAFTLLGRSKVAYPQGLWSEWFALFDDGEQGWLSEAQGIYTFTKEVADAKIDIPFDPKALQKLKIQDKNWIIEDVKGVSTVGFEGELPYVFVQGERARSIDLKDGKGGCATLSNYGGKLQYFVGEFVEFDQMEFENLREYDGW
jgi:hypothetical protein